MLKKNKAKNNHISNTVNHLNNKQLKLSFSGSEYTIIKSNHLYEEDDGFLSRSQEAEINWSLNNLYCVCLLKKHYITIKIVFKGVSMRIVFNLNALFKNTVLNQLKAYVALKI